MKERKHVCSSVKVIAALHSRSYLHDCDCSVGDSSPIDGAHHDAGSGEGSGLRDETVSQVQYVDYRP